MAIQPSAAATAKLLESFKNPYPEGTYLNARWEMARAAQSLFWLACDALRIDRLAARLDRLLTRLLPR